MIRFLKGNIVMKRFVLTIAILTITGPVFAMNKNGKTMSMVTRCLGNRAIIPFSLITGIASLLVWRKATENKPVANIYPEKHIQNDNQSITHHYPESHNYNQSQGYDDSTIRMLEQQRDPRFYGRDGR